MRSYATCLILMLACGACNPMSMARRGLSEFRGATGDYKVVHDAEPVALANCNRLTLGTVETELGALCPAEVRRAVREALRKLPDELRAHFPGGDSPLVVDLTIVWYEAGGKLGAVFGKDAQCIARADLRTPEGEAVANVYLVAKSSAVTRAGPDDLAKALAEALADYLKNKQPKRG